MILTVETRQKILTFISRLENSPSVAPRTGFFSSLTESLSENPNYTFKYLLDLVRIELDSKYYILSAKDKALLGTAMNPALNLETNTMLKMLREIIARDNFLSMLLSAFENREITKDGLKAVLTIGSVSGLLFIAPILSYSMWAVVTGLGVAGGVAYMKQKHPEFADAALNYLSLMFYATFSTSQFTLMLNNDPNYQKYLEQQAREAKPTTYRFA